MARLIELDDIFFPVVERPVFVSVVEPNGERRLPVPDKKAIVNSTTSRVLGIVSRGYRLVTNREALDMAYECCQGAFPQTKPGEWQVSAIDAPNSGGYCYIDLVHNSTALDFSLVPAAERPETFGPFIRVTNSYNALRALAFDIGFYRKVCKNGMILPETVISFKFIHLRRNIGETIRFEIAHERLRSCNWKLPGALVPPVQAMNERSCHLRIEFKIKIAHGWTSIVSSQCEASCCPQSGRPFPLDAVRINWPGADSAGIDAVLMGPCATSTSN